MSYSARMAKRNRRIAKRNLKKARNLADALDFDKIFSLENLVKSFKKCRSGVRWKNKVVLATLSLGTFIGEIYDSLMGNSYEKDKVKHFVHIERGKARHISPVSFKDRTVQRTLCDNSLIPIIEPLLISDNAASRTGKGTSFSRKRFLVHARKALVRFKNPYIVVFDFSDYFNSVSSLAACHFILKEYYKAAKICDKPLDPHLVKNIEMFITDEKGLGLGNQTSQLAAIFYCNKIDHWAESQGFFARYMDDSYLMVDGYEKAQKCLETYNNMAKELGLTLNLRKTKILKLENSNIKWLKRIYKFVKVDNSKLLFTANNRIKAVNDSSNPIKNVKNFRILARLENNSTLLYSIRVANKSLKFSIRHAKNAVEHVAKWELEKSNYYHSHNNNCMFYSTAMAELNSFKDLATTTTNNGGRLWRKMHRSLKRLIARKILQQTISRE